jgi:hypothetical protein
MQFYHVFKILFRTPSIYISVALGDSSARREAFLGIASVEFVLSKYYWDVCVNNQQMQQLFIQFVNYVW